MAGCCGRIYWLRRMQVVYVLSEKLSACREALLVAVSRPNHDSRITTWGQAFAGGLLRAF